MSKQLRLRKILEPRPDAPFPPWMVFPVIFAALYLSHVSLLRLPYYWDEAGYYIPAAWDFFRTGSLIPFTTMSNAHPPLPSVYLALWWKLSGYYPEVTREAVLIVSSFGLLAVWRLAQRVAGSGQVAFWTVLLTALYPVWFAQSTLAQADIFAAAFTLWGLVYALPDSNRRPILAALWFTAAVLSKETAIVVPMTLAILAIVDGFRTSQPTRSRRWKDAAWLAGCALALVAWYAWHFSKTGFVFGNPQFLKYNAQANLAPARFLAAFGHRLLHLTAHMNMFVPALLTIAALMLNPRVDAEGRERPYLSKTVLWQIFFILLANAVLFSVLGGALLTRYLLPMYPLVLLVAVSTFSRRVPYWQALAALSAVAFIAGLFINPPYRFAPEDNLEYARVIRLHVAGIYQLNKRYPGSTVLSAWPVTDELTKPELGYVKTPYQVYPLEDFTEGQINRAADDPSGYSTALVFSTKYDPPTMLLSLGPKSEALDRKYFGLHHDLPPEAIALRLHGTLEWQREDHDQWIALIRFNRQFEARMPLPNPVR
ncbi:glycosyltransferase family 39 protein [Telmatobacter sp. DSM 110680]|uniref:Glycosyltransferase family 39 protein n=1 Tax=Telmatobacter sp. DSM 110680 TaxID=3036704 RepID=A0AAU7DJW8_9BACT